MIDAVITAYCFVAVIVIPCLTDTLFAQTALAVPLELFPLAHGQCLFKMILRIVQCQYQTVRIDTSCLFVGIVIVIRSRIGIAAPFLLAVVVIHPLIRFLSVKGRVRDKFTYRILGYHYPEYRIAVISVIISAGCRITLAVECHTAALAELQRLLHFLHFLHRQVQTVNHLVAVR